MAIPIPKLTWQGKEVHFTYPDSAVRYECILELLRKKSFPNSKDIVDLEVARYGRDRDFRREVTLRDITHLRMLLGVPIEYSKVRRGFYLTDPKWNMTVAQLASIEMKKMYEFAASLPSVIPEIE